MSVTVPGTVVVACDSLMGPLVIGLARMFKLDGRMDGFYFDKRYEYMLVALPVGIIL